MAEVETLRGRYELGEALGAGGFGATRVALDRSTGETVVLKELDVRRAGDWKSVELFEREAQVLAELDHPCIPSYVDAFDLEEDDATRFFLVQQLAPGRSLEDLAVGGGWRPSRDEVLALARELLEVCAYLHALNPPVIHRDIKPANVMRAPDGAVSLVDFGSVKARWEERSGGSTVVGTLGYMAPEQLRGAADGRSDLFGLGSTLIYVLTRRQPEDLPTRGLRTDTEALLPDDPALARWLDRLVSPDPDGRFEGARQALDALDRIDDVVEEAAPAPSEPGAPPPSPAPRPRPQPGTIEHEQSTQRDSVGTTVGASIGLVVTAAIFMTGSVGWWSAILGPLGLLIFWVMAYTGLSAKHSVESPASQRKESSGMMASGGLAALASSMCLGFAYAATGATGAGLAAMIGLAPVVFFSWVLLVMGWDSWTEWTHRGVFEDEMRVELPHDAPSTNPLQVSRKRGGLELGRGAGLTPWTMISFGLMVAALGAGFSVGVGSVDSMLQAYPLIPILGAGAPAIGALVALWRWAWAADRLILQDDLVETRHGGRRRSAHPSEVASWELAISRATEPTEEDADPEEGTHDVTLMMHLSNGQPPMVYEESAENLADARQKRVLLDALLRKRLVGAPPPVRESEEGAVVFDWDAAWSEEETVSHEAMSKSW